MPGDIFDQVAASGTPKPDIFDQVATKQKPGYPVTDVGRVNFHNAGLPAPDEPDVPGAQFRRTKAPIFFGATKEANEPGSGYTDWPGPTGIGQSHINLNPGSSGSPDNRHLIAHESVHNILDQAIEKGLDLQKVHGKLAPKGLEQAWNQSGSSDPAWNELPAHMIAFKPGDLNVTPTQRKVYVARLLAEVRKVDPKSADQLKNLSQQYPLEMKPSDSLPTPQEIEQHTTAFAQKVVDIGSLPHPQPQPQQTIAPYQPSLGTRVLDVFRNSGVGQSLGLSSRTTEAEREDPTGNSLLRFQELTPKPGVARGAAEFASGLTTPENLLAAAGTGGLGALEKQLGKSLVSRMVSAGFSASMLKSSIDQVPQLRDAWHKEDWPQVRQTLTRMVLGGGMAAAAGLHAAKGGLKSETSKAPKEPQQEYTSTGEPVRQPDIFDKVAPEKPAPDGGKLRETTGNSGKSAAEKPQSGNKEYFRGAWNLPLNEQGQGQAKAAAERNTGQFDEIHSGTKSRHQQTAQAYAATNPRAGQVQPNAAFDPMNLGMHEGEEITPHRVADLNHRFLNESDKPVPGVGKFSGEPGEAPKAWSDRVIDGVEKLKQGWKPGKKVLVVTSGRDTQAIRAWAAKGMPADKSLDPDVITKPWASQPGEMMRLDPKTGAIEDTPTADKEGIYFQRHGETDGNDNAAVPAEIAQEKNPSAIKQFMGEETGTSRVGSIFKADIGEMRALKAKRDAAFEELEKAKETPEQTKFGRNVIAYFTGERDLWGARVNQIMARLRNLVPDSQDQEALTLMREFRGKSGELLQFLDGSHPALQGADDYAGAMEQIEKLRPVIMKALDPTDRMKQADEVLTKIAAGTLAEGQRLGFLESRWTPEQYTPHVLHPQGEGAFAKPPGRLGKALGGKIGKYFANAERREYPTVLDAIADRARPKTLNAFDAFTIHGDRFATARATNLLEQQMHASGIGRYAIHKTAPKGWVPMAPHSNEFQKIVPFLRETGEPGGSKTAAEQVAEAKLEGMRAGKSYAEVSGANANVPAQPGAVVADVATQHLYVPEFIEKALRPITDPDYMARIPGFTTLRKFQSLQKAAQLSLSMFHATTENYMALSNMGPTGWIRALKSDRFDPEFERTERDMIAHGGTSSIQGHTVEAYKALQPGSIPTVGEIIRKFTPIRWIDQSAQKITDFTFGNLQRKFKVMDFAQHKAAWMADHPNATDAELSAAKRSIAKEVNAVYGGLHWEQLGVGRAPLEMARAILLAPDWTLSNIANYKYAFEWSSPAGKLARMFWAHQYVGGMIATQLLSLAISHQFSDSPTDAYYGEDKDGQKIYQNNFFKGASGDQLSFIHNVKEYGLPIGSLHFAAGKAAPLLRVGLEAVTNRDYLGHQIVNPNLNPVAKTVRGLGKVAWDALPIPFSVDNLYQMLLGPHADRYTKPEVTSTMFSGTPPRHVPPEGMEMTSEGLREKPYRESHGILHQILTGEQ